MSPSIEDTPDRDSASHRPGTRIDRRPYLKLTPSTDRLTPATVAAGFERLHALARELGETDGLLGRESAPATIEWLLATRGGDAPVAYYVGLAPGAEHDVDPATARDRLEPIVRDLFPDTYTVEAVRWHPRAVLDATAPTATDGTDDAAPETPPLRAAFELRGVPERHDDWQTRLTPLGAHYAENSATTGRSGTTVRLPTGSIAATCATATAPVVVQTLCRPLPDWARTQAARREALEHQQDTLRDQLATAIAGRPPDDASLPPADRTRLEELDRKDPRHSFALTVRAVVGTPASAATGMTRPAGDGGPTATDDATATRDPAAIVDSLQDALGDVGQTCYRVRGRTWTADADTDAVRARYRALRNRTVADPRDGLRDRLPGGDDPAAVVADAAEAATLCCCDGGALPPAARRALATTPPAKTALPRPPADQLAPYRPAADAAAEGPTPAHSHGLLLGCPTTQDGAPTAPIALPPDLQSLHVAWFGRTGAGKSTALVNAILANHAATDGADILIDPKGDGMATDYLRAHHARYGDLDDVLYFDCAETVPAIPFFDIRDECAAGVPRPTAIADVVDHYIEILRGIMGPERFDQAVRAPDVIRYLVRAMFDPVHGADAFAHSDLHALARRMHDRGSPPAVADEDLERMLDGVADNRARTFDEIMQGVANRIEKVPADQRLARLFDHVPDDGDPRFDLADYLNEDVVIVIDTGGLRDAAQRVLTLVVLSNLWTALRRRTQRADDEPDHPLVNCYVEEAASVANADLLGTLLAQGRGFDCSLTLAMQFPGQLRETAPDTYDELLNNVGTVLTGPVPLDERLAKRLATAETETTAVAARLRALDRGTWLASLPAPFDAPAPQPFTLRSCEPPRGHPAHDESLSAATATGGAAALDRTRERTRERAGLAVAASETTGSGTAAPDPVLEADTDERPRLDSALPYTTRLPPTVTYDETIHALRCTECDSRYDPSVAGMERAVECCHSLAIVDADAIPICDLHLKLPAEEIADSDWSLRQLLFLQAVYNAQQLRYDPPAYDLLHDSMLRLQEYVGIDDDAIDELLDSDVLRHDGDHPHRLYSVSPAGREVLGEGYREGVDYGHGAGDLTESSQHALAVEVARRYLDQAYVADPDEPVTAVVPYYDLDGNRRLDVAGLDADGEIRVVVEAERLNNDVREAVPNDYDKLASCDPDEAIWVVMTQRAGHELLTALHEPPTGEPRVEKTYARTTPPQQFRIDQPGLTDVFPLEWIRERVHED